ncbi:MAG: DUF3800 domain-containing protein [Candidatus Binatus sp.]
MNLEARQRWQSTIADDYYIFLDESGNYSFDPKGTKYLIYTAVSGGNVIEGVAELLALKHFVIACGIELEYFHATVDKQAVRNLVFEIIAQLPIRIDTIVVEKAKAGPSIRPIERLYPKVFGTLVGYLLNGLSRAGVSPKRIHVFCDVPDTKKALHAVEKAVKQALQPIANSGGGFKYYVLVHASKSHPYLQFADYCCWAMYRKYQGADYRSYKLIWDLVANEFDIFNRGYKYWY